MRAFFKNLLSKYRHKRFRDRLPENRRILEGCNQEGVKKAKFSVFIKPKYKHRAKKRAFARGVRKEYRATYTDS